MGTQTKKMTYWSSQPIENFEAEEFKKKIDKELEKVAYKLHKTRKSLKTGLDEELHHKQHRRRNFLKRYRLWLNECLQDLDDIHKGITWKYEYKPNGQHRQQSRHWYEWREPGTEQELPARKILKVKTPEKRAVCKKEEVQETLPCSGIRKCSKRDALLALGYDESLVSALGL